MLQRVEGYATQHHRRGITQTRRSPGMSTLMHAEGKNKHHKLKKNDNDVQTHIKPSLLNFAE